MASKCEIMTLNHTDLLMSMSVLILALLYEAELDIFLHNITLK